MANPQTFPEHAAAGPPVGRLITLDVIRVAVVVMVIVHHAAQPYGPTGGGWPVTDTAQSDWFRPFYTVNSAIGLGLLFLLAGYLVVPACDRKGPRRFLVGRWYRLGVPLLVFAVAVNLPFAWADQGPGSIGDFVGGLYADAWRPLYLHLWFVAHLLLYTAAYVVWRRLAGNPRRAWAAPGHRAIAAYAVALIGVTWILRFRFPVDDWVPLLGLIPAEPAHLPQYVSLFVLGAMANRGHWLSTMSPALGRWWLAVGVAASVAMTAIQMLAPDAWRFNATADGGAGWQSLVRSTLEGLIGVGLAVGLPLLIRDLVHRPLRLVSAMAVTSYVAYILHVYLLVPIQGATTWPDLSPFLKFGIVAVLGVALSFGVAHLSGRVPGLRALLGTTPPR